jgi:hypothetical protein
MKNYIKELVYDLQKGAVDAWVIVTLLAFGAGVLLVGVLT